MKPGLLEFALPIMQPPGSQQRILVCGQQDLHVPAWPAAAAAWRSALHTAVVPMVTSNRFFTQCASHAPASTFKAGANAPTAVPALAAKGDTEADSSGDDTDLEYWDYYRLSRQVRAAFTG